MAKYTLPPRQKMINLLYVVLIAMLAINISSDVLEGYGLMNNDYLPQIEQLEEYNRTLLERINNSRNDQTNLISTEHRRNSREADGHTGRTERRYCAESRTKKNMKREN